MNKATEHVMENKMIYMVLSLLLSAGGTAKLTNNLPVTQGEFRSHLVAYQVSETNLRDIQNTLASLRLGQLRASLLQAYKDRCNTNDPQAISYINREIESLQEQYVTLTKRRFEPPPCGS